MPYVPHLWDKYDGPGARKTRAQTFRAWTSAIVLFVVLLTGSWIATGLHAPGQEYAFLVAAAIGLLLIASRKVKP